MTKKYTFRTRTARMLTGLILLSPAGLFAQGQEEPPASLQEESHSDEEAKALSPDSVPVPVEETQAVPGDATPLELDETSTADQEKQVSSKSSESDDDQAESEASPDPPPEPDKAGTPALPPREGEQAPPEEWHEDYDGRPDAKRAEDALIWIPRTPLYPVHLTLDYGVRWPIVKGLSLAEEHKVFKRVEDVFTFADGRAGLFPIAFYDTGRGFWGGASFFFNDWGRRGHSFRATAGAGTNAWLMVNLRDSWRIFEDDRGKITFGLMAHRNPTFLFTGIGPDTSVDDEVYFGEDKIEGTIDLEVDLEDLSRFAAGIDFRRAKLGKGRAPSITSSESAFDPSNYTGFADAFFIGGVEMKLDLDSRSPKTEYIPGSGVRLESWGGYNYGFGSTRLSFFNYGISPMVFWDISGANHVLLARVYLEAQSRTGGDDVPLNELVTLGGNKHLRGFISGRFRGESAFVTSLDYSWPLLAFADAWLFSEIGNVYNGFYEDFAFDKMIIDWGTGLRSSFSRELQVWLAVGFGSNQIDQWDDGFDVDNVRVFMGAGRAL